VTKEPTNPIPADKLYTVDVVCPVCGAHADILLTIQGQLTKQKSEAKLGVKCGQKKVDHRCRQGILDSATGELLPFGESDGDGS